jgi:hypothetical protein
LVSADTFNQIFDTIEKINRTVVDSDLVGVWSCDAMTTRNTTGWSSKSLFYILENSQVNLTASASATSLESAYTISTSSPSPFKRTLSSAFRGTYILYNNKLFTKQADESEARIWDVNIISPTRFELTFLETSAQSFPTNYASFITCDSAEAVPASPTSPTATNNKTGINLAWTDASSDETGFKVYRKLSTESEYKSIASPSENSYDDTTLSDGAKAYYQIVSYNTIGESAKSKTVSATADYTSPSVSAVTPVAGISLNASDTISLSDTDYLSPRVSFSEPVAVAVAYAEVVDTSDNSVIDTIDFSYGGQPGSTYNHTDLINTLSFYVEYESGKTYKVKLKKISVTDGAGNSLEADYIWSFSMK